MQPAQPAVWTLLFACVVGWSWAEYVLYTVLPGRVTSGNYSNYKILREGYLRLTLESIVGDADLYVSDTNQTPNFEDYELKSATCGEDTVYIDGDMKRPLWVGVYGYVSYEVSSYKMHVYIDHDARQRTYDGLAQLDSGSTRDQEKKPGVNAVGEKEESWAEFIVLTIIKILFEVLFS